MMGRKSDLLKFKNFTDVSMAADATSPATNIQFMDNIGVQLHFEGTPTGEFFVEVSIDHAQDSQGVVTTAGHWVAISLPEAAVASGADGDIYIDMTQLSAPWIRVRYARASGTGTLNGWICGKML